MVGYDTPASGNSGSVVGELVDVAVAVAVGVDVGLPVGVAVGDVDGVGVGLPDGVGVGLPLGVVSVNVKAVQPTGAAASGLLVGAVGATGSCLNW